MSLKIQTSKSEVFCDFQISIFTTLFVTPHTSQNQRNFGITMSYDDLCKVVNDAYRKDPGIRIRTLANDLGIPFDVVWECLGFKDWFDFVETGGD